MLREYKDQDIALTLCFMEPVTCRLSSVSARLRQLALDILPIEYLLTAAVWALTLQHTHPRIATDVHYVAGDRVVSDPLCKPFSMGRNLFCVHSKKHMNDDPALKAAKSKTNRQTLITLSRELNKVSV